MTNHFTLANNRVSTITKKLKKSIPYSSLFAVFVFSFFFSQAQKIEQISLVATSEAIGLPFTNHLSYHPGFETKLTFKSIEKEKTSRMYSLNAGFFHHPKISNSLYIGGEYTIQYPIVQNRLGLDIPIGIGYMHTFYPGEAYKQNTEGEFEAISQFGRPKIYANAGIGLSYTGANKIKPFVRQELLIETFFANGLPAIPHSLFKLGLHYTI